MALARIWSRSALVVVLGALLVMAVSAGFVWAQTQYPMQPMQPPQAPVGPGPQAAPPGPPPPQQQPLEYAFRPDLTNPEFGECLQLEKSWQALWQRYAQAYQTAMSMSPQHPQYQQQASYVNGLKAQLDVAWNAFSGKCIYFPSRR